MIPAWERALDVQTELLRQIDNPNWPTMARFWLKNREAVYGRHAMLPSGVAFQNAREIVVGAEPIFVTEEMLALTAVAMETFDPSEPVRVEDFFIPRGMALLERQFLAKDAQDLNTGWRAVTWRTITLPGEADPDGIEQPAMEILLWSSLEDEDEWDAANPEVFAAARQQYAQWGMRWMVMHATLVPLSYMSDIRHMGNEGDPQANWLTFVRVLNRLMEEKIVLKSRVRPHRAIRRAAQRAGLPDVSDVLVVELRRARPRGFEWPESGDGHAHYSHSFMVQGHWRNQPYGPGKKLRRQQWISPYVKGEGEFREKKRVWVWDR